MEQAQSGDYYIAVIVYESSSDALDYTPTYEESFVLLQAGSEQEAQSKAHAFAAQRGGSFANAVGQKIAWSLKKVVDVNRTLSDKLADGTELYSRHFKDYEAYKAFEPLLGRPLG
jgi:hypothetical protein